MRRVTVRRSWTVWDRGGCRRGASVWSVGGGRLEAAEGEEGEEQRRERQRQRWQVLNIYQEGSPPEMLPDDAYPEWLWKLTERVATKSELIRRAESALRKGGEEEVARLLSAEERKRLFARAARQRQRRGDATFAQRPIFRGVNWEEDRNGDNNNVNSDEEPK